MTEYNVDFPVVMHIGCVVEAESEEDAIRKALDNYEGCELRQSEYVIVEGEALRRVVQGNVYYGCIREAEATEEA
jgi:hypothetical protein